MIELPSIPTVNMTKVKLNLFSFNHLKVTGISGNVFSNIGIYQVTTLPAPYVTQPCRTVWMNKEIILEI